MISAPKETETDVMRRDSASSCRTDRISATVHVPDDMPAEAIAHGKRPFKIDLAPGFAGREPCAAWFQRRIGGKSRTRRFYRVLRSR